MRGFIRRMSCVVILLAAGCGEEEPSVAESEQALRARLVDIDRRLRPLEKQLGISGGPAKRKRAGKPPDTGLVRLEGDAEEVTLADGDHRFDIPGQVPAGKYTIVARFPTGGAPVEAGSVKVVATRVVTLRCTASSASCRKG